MRTIIKLASLSVLPFVAASTSKAEGVKVDMHQISAEGVGASMGALDLAESAQGLSISGQLTNLTAGEHGFHIHEKPNCGPGEKDGKVSPGIAAGSHFDPKATKKHAGPDGNGHLGDLPKLVVSADGKISIVAPHLKLADVKAHALVIHEGGDNYSDAPEAGGGGKRIACGVIE